MNLSPIWIIDDDPIARLLIEKRFTRDFDQVQCAQFSNGEEALEKLKEIEPDDYPGLIILDLNMPILDGWGFLDELNIKSDLKNLKVAVLTSSIDAFDEEKAKEYQQVKAFLTKPMNVDQLKADLGISS